MTSASAGNFAGVSQGAVRMGQFWATHQRFFRTMLMCAKVEAVVKMARQAVEHDNQCVVIGLQASEPVNPNPYNPLWAWNLHLPVSTGQRATDPPRAKRLAAAEPLAHGRVRPGSRC